MTKLHEHLFSIEKKSEYIIIRILGLKLRFKNGKFYNNIDEIKDELKVIKYDNHLIFKYISGLDLHPHNKERECVSDYRDVPNDHLVRYLAACEFISKDDKVLDCACGCGYGSSCLKINANPKEIIAGDIEPKAIEFANRMYANQKIKYEVIDACDSDKFGKETFDKIVSFETIEHVPNEIVSKALKNFYSWLKPGGKIICSVPNENILPWSSAKNNFHFHHYTSEEFKALLENFGFKNVKIFYTDTVNLKLCEEYNDNCNETIMAVADK